MNSKVLRNEYRKEIENVGTLYYGTQNEEKCDIIEITVKGRFVPKTVKKDYSKESASAKKSFMDRANNFISKREWIDSHYIFTADITEKGIKPGKTCKFKYKVFIRPKSKRRINAYERRIDMLVHSLNLKLKKCMNENGLELARTN